tara:strand:- start:549 stop:827 length:279 start_codon:yes stop_codon:yes gene_type:complete
MSETQQFTKEEIDQITELRNANATKINEFGQVELELLLSNQRLDQLNATRADLENEYVALQEKERTLVKQLNDKYGTGTVDLDSGEFVPKKA